MEDLKLSYNEINAIRKEVELLEKNITVVMDERKKEIAAIRSNGEAHFQLRHKEYLSGISIEILSQAKQGIKTAYLQKSGITNFYQLSKMSYSEIRAVEGIGTQNAKKINNLKRTILDELKNDVPLQINIENPSNEEKQLVRSICIFLCHEDIRQEIKKLYSTPKSSVQKFLESTDKCSNTLKWLFMNDNDKKDISEIAESLRKFLKYKFSEIADLLEKYKEVCNSDDNIYLSHFNSYSNFYYATIEKYCKRITSAQKIRNDMSEEFVKEIEKQQINISSLKHPLRPYQIFGIKYMIAQKKVLLGDEMGLGKTVQAIGAMATLKSAKKSRFMVICPASVLTNWIKEIEKFSNLNAIKIHGADQDAFDLWYKNGGVVVTTYDSVFRLEYPIDFKLDFLAVDEAHYVKNPEAKRTKFVLKLVKRSERVVYMTGTPLVNRVDEMCYLVSCLQPEITAKLELSKSAANAEQFKYNLAPVYLRRLSSDVVKELPALIKKDQWCVMNSLERDVYQKSLQHGSYADIRRVSWNTDDTDHSCKAMRLKELSETAKEQNRRVLIFSTYLETIQKVENVLGDAVVGVITGKVSPNKRAEIIDKFSQSEPGSVLVCQIVAGGVGLNIQSASVVVFCEPQLTPAAENQALKRVHRMGQTRDVVVYRLIADDTVDERILEILAEKRAAFDRYAAESIIAEIYNNTEKQKEESVLISAIKAERERLGLA